MSNLSEFIEEVTGTSHLRVEQDLGDGFVLLRASEAERRQAKHDIRSSEDIVIEMLRNSRDAHSRNIFVASWKEKETRNITVIDDGDGIPLSMIDRIFDARVTSKLDTMRMDIWGVHGRGMALFAIKENADKAYVAASLPHGGGSSLHVESSTQRLGERRDQSTFPIFHTDSNGTTTVRGPKNICRTVIEFAYIEDGNCFVYFGSPAEISAALLSFGKNALPQETLVFCPDPQEQPVSYRLALCASPEEFASLATDLGLPMSSRTARRVMNGEIKAPAPISPQDFRDDRSKSQGLSDKESESLNNSTDQPASSHNSDLEAVMNAHSHVKPKISREDLDEFTSKIEDAFSDIAETYYLDQSVSPHVVVSKDKLTITIPMVRRQ